MKTNLNKVNCGSTVFTDSPMKPQRLTLIAKMIRKTLRKK